MNESLHRLLYAPRAPLLLYRSVLRSALLPNGPDSRADVVAIVYCSRAGAFSRVVLGEDALVRRLRERFDESAVTVMNESDASDLAGAARTVGGASVLIGAQGAALAHMTLCAPGTLVFLLPTADAATDGTFAPAVRTAVEATPDAERLTLSAIGCDGDPRCGHILSASDEYVAHVASVLGHDLYVLPQTTSHWHGNYTLSDEAAAQIAEIVSSQIEAHRDRTEIDVRDADIDHRPAAPAASVRPRGKAPSRAAAAADIREEPFGRGFRMALPESLGDMARSFAEPNVYVPSLDATVAVQPGAGLATGDGSRRRDEL